MKRIRGGSGLGDSVYLRPIAEYIMARGESVTVLSDYPDVFLGCNARVESFRRNGVDILAHYAAYREEQDSTQYNDMLRCAHLPNIPLSFKWEIRNQRLVKRIRDAAKGRPVLMVHGGRQPFGRPDGYGIEILPARNGFMDALKILSDCYTVSVGRGEQLYKLPIDLDLQDQTSIAELLDITMACDGVLTQCGFPVPMAECFDKPLLAVWSGAGLRSKDALLATITPKKILSKATSQFVIDDWDEYQIYAKALAFRKRLWFH